MKILIRDKDCTHEKELSVYNCNYYTLPFIVNGCNVLYEEYCDYNGLQERSIGVMIDNKFEKKYYLNTYNDDFIEFNSESISIENKY